jgi:hypothetical protein
MFNIHVATGSTIFSRVRSAYAMIMGKSINFSSNIFVIGSRLSVFWKARTAAREVKEAEEIIKSLYGGDQSKSEWAEAKAEMHKMNTAELKFPLGVLAQTEV